MTRPPRADSPHFPFYQHVLAGGRVWRDDKLNHVQEWVDLARLNGDAASIKSFGHRDLRLVDEAEAVAETAAPREDAP